jgi:phosphate uptake regulator
MGGKTFVVSLPSTWVKKYNVQKGQELHVEPKDNSVLVSTENFVHNPICELNVSATNRILGRTIGALYKSGYGQVKVTYNTPLQLYKIEQTLKKTCMGFEITEQGKNYVLIKSLSKILPKEFSNSLKRLFYTLEVMSEQLQEALKLNEKEMFDFVVAKDDQVNKLADFCRRVINLGELKHEKKVGVIYYVVEQLERIGDIYKKIALLAKENNSKLKKQDIEHFKEINDLFISYRKMYYSFNLDSAEDFGKSFDTLKHKITAKDTSFYSIYQDFLVEQIFDMTGALLTLRL